MHTEYMQNMYMVYLMQRGFANQFDDNGRNWKPSVNRSARAILTPVLAALMRV